MSLNLSEDEFPAPDTTAMEKWYTVVKYEYDIFKGKLFFLVKPKTESRPLTFKATFYDADGVSLGENFIVALSANTPVGQTERTYTPTLSESTMKKWWSRE